MKERIAILLTVHNRKEKTLQCLRNIDEQKYDKEKYEVKIYLTDDGCTDGTPEAVGQEFPYVHIIKGDGNLFWNRGMIAAWKEAAKCNYDYYLWLNDDTYLYEDVVVRLLKSSENHNENDIIIGTTCAVGNKSDITYGGWYGGKLLTNVSREQKCQTLNGNIVLVPRNVYKMLGTMNPYYRHALGDHDYGLTATECGIEIWTAEGIMGECDRHDRPTIWMDPAQPFKKRWKNLFSPTGNNPFEFFYYRRKHFGCVAACLTFISIFVHFLFPRFWKNSYIRK